MTITVEEGAQPPVNTVPVADEDAYSAVEGQPLVLPAPGVLANDTDADGDVLTASGATQPVNGTVTLAADGSFTYTPDAGFSGKDVFTYTASDGKDVSAPAKVTITVEDENGGLATTAVDRSRAAHLVRRDRHRIGGGLPGGGHGDSRAVPGDDGPRDGHRRGGEATLLLPAKALRPGTYDLTLRYVGEVTHQASSSMVEVVVNKVIPTMEVTAMRESGNRARITVRLSAAHDVPVTGEVRVTIEGGATLVGTVSDGRAVFVWPKIKGGQLTLTAAYLGSDLVEAVSEDLTIKVRK